MHLTGIQPLVSIITVTMDCGSTIGRTLESIQAIKSPDIEYIIIDGLSTDDTLPIIQCHAGLVDILISEKDSGIYNAMNKGAALATGQYILYINGDDRVIADGFNQAKAILKCEHPQILSCQAEVILPDETHAGLLKPAPRLLYFFNSIPHLSTFVSSKLQKAYKFREDMKIASDYDLFLRLFLSKHRFRVAEVVTATHYRGGFSSNVERSLFEIRQIKKERLGMLRYFVVRFIESLHRTRKAMVAQIKGGRRAPLAK